MVKAKGVCFNHPLVLSINIEVKFLKLALPNRPTFSGPNAGEKAGRER